MTNPFKVLDNMEPEDKEISLMAVTTLLKSYGLEIRKVANTPMNLGKTPEYLITEILTTLITRQKEKLRCK